MRIFKGSIFFVLLCSCLFSYSSARQQNEERIKISLEIQWDKAVLALAGYTTDQQFNRALKEAAQTSATAAQFTTAFINHYRQLEPNGNLPSFFSLNTYNSKSGAGENLQNYLLRTLSNQIKDMNKLILHRLDKFCTITPEQVSITQEQNRILVQINGTTTIQSLDSALAQETGLQFWTTKNFTEMSAYLVKINQALAKDKALQLSSKIKDPLFDLLLLPVLPGGQITEEHTLGQAAVRDTARISHYLQRQSCIEIIPDSIHLIWGKPRVSKNKDTVALYAIVKPPNGQPLLGQEDIYEFTDDYNQGKPGITFKMNTEGSRKWALATKANINKAIAMEWHHFIISAPVVNDVVYGGASSSISGDFNRQEIKDLLSAGRVKSFPLSFRIQRIEFAKPKE